MPYPQPPGIETPRLRLEPLRVEHADEMANALGDPELHKFIGGQPATAAELNVRYARLAAADARARGRCNWVVRHRGSGEAIGTTQATLTKHDGHLVGELAWVIAVSSQGHGYGTEAVRATMKWLRADGVKVFIAHIHPSHHASAGVARAVGLRPTEIIHDGETRWTSAA